VLRLTGVGKRFRNGTEALSGIDLEVAAGEFVSLLGPSGCGKSTLLRLVAGLDPPSTGSLERAVTPGPSGHVGFVFQDPTLMPWATAVDNAALPLRLAGVTADHARARAREALRRVGLGGFEGAWPRELSGGMRMRVSLARALVTEPRLLLLDEPFAALDEITRLRLNEDLRELWAEGGLTVLFVTHSVFESAWLSNRVVVLRPRPGRVHADVAVELPAARGPELRTTPAYNAACRALSARLSEAMAA
jgi:NitT/TauT family transport system ATP-binding protein